MKDLITEQREYVKYIDNHRTSDYVLSPYLWRKDWVRPYESLYSALRMFERLNSFVTSSAFSVIYGKKVFITNHDYLPPFLSAACNGIINSKYNVCHHVAAFFSAGNKDTIASFPQMNEEARQLLVASDYRFCPLCHAKGYHSWFYQYRGLKVCPIHHVPFESLQRCRDDKQVSVMDAHPLLYKIDTEPIEKACNNLSLNAKSIELFTMNAHFDIRAYGKMLGRTPLLNIGEEIYTRDSQNHLDVEKEMSSRFLNVIYKITTSLDDTYNELDAKQILEKTFCRNGIHRNNPRFSETKAGCLQIYITLMELKLQYEQDDFWNEILSEAFDKYMYYVLGMDDYFSFRRFYHPYAKEAYNYHTLVYISSAFGDSRNCINDRDALLYAIDDHIRFQWERYRKLVIVEGMDKNNAINVLPAVAYLSITDDNGIIHLQRLVWKSRFPISEKVTIL